MPNATPTVAYRVLGGSSQIDVGAPSAWHGTRELPGYSLALVRFKVG